MTPSRLTNLLQQWLFLAWLIVVCASFLWLRLDFNNRVYFHGDGDLVTELLRLMLQSGDWESNWHRLVALERFQQIGQVNGFDLNPVGHFYNLGSYMVLAAAFCKLAFALGWDATALPLLLHCFNVLLQIGCACLLFHLGKQLKDRWLGLVAVTCFTVFPLAVLEAHYERPESLLSLLTLATLVLAFHWKNFPRACAILTGACIALAAAAKLNQLFLGLVPAIVILANIWHSRATWQQSFREATLQTLFMVIAGFALLLLVMPDIIIHGADFLREMASPYAFQKHPDPPYLVEDFSAMHQLQMVLNYHLAITGLLFVCMIAAGAICILRQNFSSVSIALRLTIILPALLLIVYHAQFPGFYERSLSPLHGILMLLAACGVYQAVAFFPKRIEPALMLLLTVFAVAKPIQLDTHFVNRFVKQQGNEQRLLFQQQLKQHFPGFWIKPDIDDHFYVHSIIPEKPPKAPRIYVLRDYNDTASSRYLALLQQNGFHLIGEYRSEFFGMPPNNLTIYHEAGRYWYLVLDEDLPTNISKDFYFANFVSTTQ